jgi:hypothetical protein
MAMITWTASSDAAWQACSEAAARWPRGKCSSCDATVVRLLRLRVSPGRHAFPTSNNNGPVSVSFREGLIVYLLDESTCQRLNTSR